MRPPICEVCGREARDTVAFANYESLPEGMTGHPVGLGWFCRLHLAGARALQRKTMGRAVARLRALSIAAIVALVTLLALALALGFLSVR